MRATPLLVLLAAAVAHVAARPQAPKPKVLSRESFMRRMSCEISVDMMPSIDEAQNMHACCHSETTLGEKMCQEMLYHLMEDQETGPLSMGPSHMHKPRGPGKGDEGGRRRRRKMGRHGRKHSMHGKSEVGPKPPMPREMVIEDMKNAGMSEEMIDMHLSLMGYDIKKEEGTYIMAHTAYQGLSKSMEEAQPKLMNCLMREMKFDRETSMKCCMDETDLQDWICNQMVVAMDVGPPMDDGPPKGSPKGPAMMMPEAPPPEFEGIPLIDMPQDDVEEQQAMMERAMQQQQERLEDMTVSERLAYYQLISEMTPEEVILHTIMQMDTAEGGDYDSEEEDEEDSEEKDGEDEDSEEDDMDGPPQFRQLQEMMMMDAEPLIMSCMLRSTNMVSESGATNGTAVRGFWTEKVSPASQGGESVRDSLMAAIQSCPSATEMQIMNFPMCMVKTCISDYEE